MLPPTENQPPIVVFRAEHPVLAAQLANAGNQVMHFPFSVGRPPDPAEEAPAKLLDLSFADERPYWIGRVQFTLVRNAAGITLIDSTSPWGNIVNGQLIGPTHGQDSIELSHGENEIIMGGRGSPYVLYGRVEPYAAYLETENHEAA